MGISFLISAIVLICTTLLPVYTEKEPVYRDTGLVCAVDLGSNTFKFIVAEIKKGEYVQHLDIRKTAGVGDDLEISEKTTGRKVISDGKLTEIQSILARFQDDCEKMTHSRRMYGIATAAFREAENRLVVEQRLREQDIQVQILTGKEESAYAYEVATLGEPEFAVVDLGSRTTEFVTKRRDTYQSAEVPTGYKVAWDAYYEEAENFNLASSDHIRQLKSIIGEKETLILIGRKELRVVEVGETSGYVLQIPQNEIEGKIITRAQIKKELQKLRVMDSQSFADLKKNLKDAPKILPRLVLLDFIMDATGYDRFRGTDRELNFAIVHKLGRPSQ